MTIISKRLFMINTSLDATLKYLLNDTPYWIFCFKTNKNLKKIIPKYLFLIWSSGHLKYFGNHHKTKQGKFWEG